MPVDIISGLPDRVVGIVAKGTVDSDDYTSVIEPAVDEVLAEHDKIRLLYVLGPDFTGCTIGGAWEDGKLGMGHLTRWEMIAMVTDHEWIRHTVQLLGHLLPGKVKVFSADQMGDARAWVAS